MLHLFGHACSHLDYICQANIVVFVSETLCNIDASMSQLPTVPRLTMPSHKLQLFHSLVHSSLQLPVVVTVNPVIGRIQAHDVW